MNESEIRRKELLKQTRKLYQDRYDIPAVHPRYGRIYKELYPSDDNESKTGGSFYLRLVLGILLFLCFVYMDQNSMEVADVSSRTITEQIEKEVDAEMLNEVWKTL